MRFKFKNPDTALGFSEGLAAPDEFDVYASVEGCVVEVLGLDDHEQMRVGITAAAISAGGEVLPDAAESDQ